MRSDEGGWVNKDARTPYSYANTATVAEISVSAVACSTCGSIHLL